MDVLALAGTRYKSFKVPSWVRDCSQKLSLLFPSDFLDPGSVSREQDYTIRYSHLIIFNTTLEFDNEIQISRNTGCMRIRAVKLCDVAGWISQAHDHTNVVIPKGERGNLIITIPGITYQIMTDHLYLLSGWNHPVILRREEKSGIYSLISVCALSFGPPSSSRRWLRPWHASLSVSEDGVIKIPPFSNGEDDMILHLHARFLNLYTIAASEVHETEVTPPLSTVKNHIMTFSLLATSSLPGIEVRLRDRWTSLYHRLGWLFSDKTAVRALMNDIDEGIFGQQYGESRIPLNPYKDTLFMKFCGVEFPIVQRWDLRHFCWSFLTAIERDSTVVGNSPSPVLEASRSQINEVKSWSEVTGQLFGVFEFTGKAFQHASMQFPGIYLQQKWYHKYERFCEVNTQPQGPREQGQQNRNILLDTTCLWDWSEFETHLRARETVWGQKLPAALDAATNTTMAAHMGLSALGLSLYHEETVGIV
jgi:hypothetical protein